MDSNSESHHWQWPDSPVHHSIDDGIGACMLCRRNISLQNDATWDLDVFSLCSDCKLLIFQDIEPLIETYSQRRTDGFYRSTSSESLGSVDSIFSANVVNIMRQEQPNVSFRSDQSFNRYDSSAMQSRNGSSRTTPSGSRRWLRVGVPSDTESLELESIYAGSESNLSFGGSRNFRSEIDSISFSAYGGVESDISVEGSSFRDMEYFPRFGNDSDYDSDTDIDPMHAGGVHLWDSEETDDDDWETDNDINLEETNEEPRNSDFLISRSSERSGNITTLHRNPEAVVNSRTVERRQLSNILIDLEDLDFPLHPHIGNIEEYLEVAGIDFEAFRTNFALTDTEIFLRQGAPPAAKAFLRNLTRIVITEEHFREQHDYACAICKDQIIIGSELNQLPCSHIYHPDCIITWLSVRNSCPLCRFEVPSDDLLYEETRQRRNTPAQVQLQQYINDDDLSRFSGVTESPPTDSTLLLQVATPDVCTDINEYGGENRRGWLYIAAPIVSIVGLALVLWLGSPLSCRREAANPRNLQAQNEHLNIHTLIPLNIRGDNQRRWWSFF